MIDTSTLNLEVCFSSGLIYDVDYYKNWDAKYPSYILDVKKAFKTAKYDSNTFDYSKYPVFKYDPISDSLKHIIDFKIDVTNNIVSIGSLRNLLNAKAQECSEENRNLNINKILGKFNHGMDADYDMDTLVSVWGISSTCSSVVLVYDGVEISTPAPEAIEWHHYCIINGSSFMKTQDPSHLLKRPFTSPGYFSDPKNVEAMKELFFTFPVTSGEHKTFHSTSRPYHGLDNYPKSKISWTLRNEENYNTFFSYMKKEFNFDIGMTFDEFMTKASLKNMLTGDAMSCKEV